MSPLLKSIAIGCDDTSTLSAVLASLPATQRFTHNILTATRTADLMNITKSLLPDLVILCFRNNQAALNDFCPVVKKNDIPVLCLDRRSEGDRLRWNKENIVFSYSLDHIKQGDYLLPRIHSIFLMHSVQRPADRSAGTLAQAAEQMHNADHARDLSRYVLELDQKTEVLTKVKERIACLYPQVDDSTRVELTSIVNAIRASANDTKLWDDFKLYFERTNPGFLMILANKHPELTSKDLKYCCYLKMNMSNDDIRNLLGINQESVRTHKYRLKKKMYLAPEQDLIGYLRAVDRQ